MKLKKWRRDHPEEQLFLPPLPIVRNFWTHHEKYQCPTKRKNSYPYANADGANFVVSEERPAIRTR